MPLALVDTSLPTLPAWAHALAPAGSTTFEVLTGLSLVGYLVFAVVALYYALQPWAEKVMCAAIGIATAVSLLLHLSLLSTPAYVGEGPLWKFVAISRYLLWAVLSLGGMYVLYRMWSRWRTAKNEPHGR